MKILTLNRGSSSMKCSLYEFASIPDDFVEPIWEEKIEWKNIANKEEIFDKLAQLLPKETIDCVGHRIVHGGEKYTESILITPQVRKDFQSLFSLAPLHNPACIEGIDLIEKLFPGVAQVAVFDTAFHKTIDVIRSTYPGPYSWVEKGIRKYGFHGISFSYCTKKAAKVLGEMPEKMIICHLGSGASLCAVEKGKSIDTTMGFTPLDGLMMDTRSGSIDPGILLHLFQEQNAEELTKDLYEKSGLLGISGASSDMRDLLQSNEKRARLAVDMYVHRLCSLIGSMAAVLGGVDVLVFTGGIGENSAEIRENVCSQMKFLGAKELVIQTKEAFEIALDTVRIHG